MKICTKIKNSHFPLAKGNTIEFNGNKEAKGLWSLTNIHMKSRPFNIKPTFQTTTLWENI